MSVSFANPVAVIGYTPIANGSDVPTLGGMVLLRKTASGKKYNVYFRWEAWSVVEDILDARDNGDEVTVGSITGIIPALEDIKVTHAGEYGTEADPSQLTGYPMDIWNGSFSLIVPNE